MPTTVGVQYGLGVFELQTPCGVAWGHDGSFRLAPPNATAAAATMGNAVMSGL